MDTGTLLQKLRQARLDGDIVDPGHADYNKSRRVWNAIADRNPYAIVHALSADDVAKVVTVAAETNALLAVRGGGHSIPGISTCDDGIVLDLSRMNAVSLDRSSNTAEAMGGALLGALDRTCVSAGRVVPSGVVAHTGVGGLTLGGGMGWLSRRLGLTIDSLIAADIVTADGRTRRISLDSEPDLFWAIRGGGGNFGVVTNFVFQTYPFGSALIGDWTYPFSDARAVLKRYRELAAQAPRAVTTAIFLSAAGLRIAALWTGEGTPDEAAITCYGKLGQPQSAALGAMTFLELQSSLDDLMAWNQRYYSKGGYFHEIGDDVIDRMIDSTGTDPNFQGNIYALQLGGAIADIDDDATPYTGRKAGHYWIVGAGWTDPADDAKLFAWCRKTSARMVEVSMRGNYVNEQGDVGNEVAVSAYGEQKYRRLAKLKARYDPANLFRLNQNIEPRP
jgi:FAD/FMN-containing dehydrogenase